MDCHLTLGISGSLKSPYRFDTLHYGDSVTLKLQGMDCSDAFLG